MAVDSTDEPPKSPQQPLPMLSNSAEDALADTTRALSTGSPTLQTLQRECSDLLAGEHEPLKGDLILKLASIFTYEEILAKAQTIHGDASLTHAALAGRIKDAKAKVAKSRGALRKQVSDEMEGNCKVSGAAERTAKLGGARSLATRYGRTDRLEGFEGVARRNQFVAAGKSIGIGEVGARAEMAEEREVGRKRKRVDDDDDDVASESGFPSRAGKSTGAAAIHRTPSTSVEPFDPTPYGQPYAGTSLYVPGFRTDGDMSWQEWLEENPYPHEVYWT